MLYNVHRILTYILQCKRMHAITTLGNARPRILSVDKSHTKNLCASWRAIDVDHYSMPPFLKTSVRPPASGIGQPKAVISSSTDG